MEENKSDTLNTMKIKTVPCRLCKQKIEEQATVCYHCGKYQKPIFEKIQIAAQFIAIMMVLVAIAQVGISFIQMQEAKRKRVEADNVLAQARGVLDNTIKYSDETREKVYSIRREVDNTTINIRNKVDNTATYVNKQLHDQEKRVLKTQATLNGSLESVSTNLLTLKTEVSTEIKKLKGRDELRELADTAIALSDRNTYSILSEIGEKRDTLTLAVIAEASRVKSYYLVTNRIYKDIELMDKDGKNHENDNISTDILISNLFGSPDWRLRGKVAVLLGTRKEKKVVDALIKAIQNDPSLDVLVHSIRSFSNLTGYKIIDVFDNMPRRSLLVKWWNENRDRIQKDFK